MNKPRIILSFLGGVLMGLCPAPFGLWMLAWIALIPLWRSLFLTSSYKQIILLTLAWGCGYHGLALFWITGVHPMTWMGVPWLASISIALFCWIFITLWGAALVVVWGVGFKFITKRVTYKANIAYALFRVLIGVSLWCVLESLWSNTPLWWSSLSYTQSPDNLFILQLSKISGFNTITASIVLINGLWAEALLFSKYFKQTSRKIILFTTPLFLAISIHSFGFYLYQLPIAGNNLDALKVGIIQGNIPNEIKLYPKGFRKAIAGYTTGYKKLAQQEVDVVLTPETALPFYWENITNNSDFYRTVLQYKIPAWVGAFGTTDQGFTNSLFTLTGEGKTYSRYDKSILVPLGEYVPLQNILGKIIDRLSPLKADLIPGTTNQIFNTPWGKAIVGICYESAFSQHFRRQAKQGGQFIITASNNAHYSNTMPAQHHAQDVLRAVESDRWTARATNTGYSGIVDPHGNTIWRSAINQYQIHSDTIYLRQTQTLYVRWGDWLTVILLLNSLIIYGIVNC
ncbi:MAG: apolipoprotein N-acyltransferase [Xenococcaceae cyanobacterium MO_207.B15]|nr:apolipoprotein N-acyltransferase [Xenococcaceae cyanobacterium MO_207.B15]